jgi:hypothetical protein
MMFGAGLIHASPPLVAVPFEVIGEVLAGAEHAALITLSWADAGVLTITEFGEVWTNGQSRIFNDADTAASIIFSSDDGNGADVLNWYHLNTQLTIHPYLNDQTALEFYLSIQPYNGSGIHNPAETIVFGSGNNAALPIAMGISMIEPVQQNIGELLHVGEPIAGDPEMLVTMSWPDSAVTKEFYGEVFLNGETKIIHDQDLLDLKVNAASFNFFEGSQKIEVSSFNASAQYWAADMYLNPSTTVGGGRGAWIYGNTYNNSISVFGQIDLDTVHFGGSQIDTNGNTHELQYVNDQPVPDVPPLEHVGTPIAGDPEMLVTMSWLDDDVNKVHLGEVFTNGETKIFHDQDAGISTGKFHFTTDNNAKVVFTGGSIGPYTTIAWIFSGVEGLGRYIWVGGTGLDLDTNFVGGSYTDLNNITYATQYVNDQPLDGYAPPAPMKEVGTPIASDPEMLLTMSWNDGAHAKMFFGQSFTNGETIRFHDQNTGISTDSFNFSSGSQIMSIQSNYTLGDEVGKVLLSGVTIYSMGLIGKAGGFFERVDLDADFIGGSSTDSNGNTSEVRYVNSST